MKWFYRNIYNVMYMVIELKFHFEVNNKKSIENIILIYLSI